VRGVFSEKQSSVFLVKLSFLLVYSMCAWSASAKAEGKTAHLDAKTPVKKSIIPRAVHQSKKIHHAAISHQTEELKVTGSQRYMQTGSDMKLERRIMQNEVPGQNILKALGQLPGTSYSSSDPLGIDGWSSSIRIRGFSQNQLGVTLDGIPLNDQTYANLNGLNINNAVISDDIGRVSLSVGAGGGVSAV
jgi:iron complex outermembrane receptor protein